MGVVKNKCGDLTDRPINNYRAIALCNVETKILEKIILSKVFSERPSVCLSVCNDMNFRLVPNSVTLNDLERRKRPNGCVISPNSVAFRADCVKVVEDTRILSVAEM